MNLSDFIKQAQEKGLLSVAPLKLKGQPKARMGMLYIMAKTVPIEDSKVNWELIAGFQILNGGASQPQF